ncbi:hypothetical protein SAMN06295933_1992 [Desulfovibrio gilichinskyi]|uniref:Uncharacterized protein n=1 Tax=Desulfovibrio gilichinskyi TaxID=1519643 RepID=A0A1X7DKD9_9BACT|nr:hypothetical protein SAMN06295933_1992 [Desulfovibrio gilichinskyi]
MKLNIIQVSIFKKLSKEKGLEVDSYVEKYSMEFINLQRNKLEDLSEEEGDEWINKEYLISLSDAGCNIL